LLLHQQRTVETRQKRSGSWIDLYTTSLSQFVFGEASAQYAYRADFRLTRRFRIVRSVPDSNCIAPFDRKLFQDGYEDVGRRFWLIHIL
jgi:hypothetical protein